MTKTTVPTRAIKKLVDYLYCDEQRQFEECTEDGKPTDHIFHSVRTVERWLEQQAKQRNI